MTKIIDYRKIFVGRDAETELFRRFMSDQLPNRSIFGVSGEAGIGKSHWLNHLRQIAEKQNPNVAFIDFYETGNRKYHVLLHTLASQLGIDSGFKELLQKLANAREDDVKSMLNTATEHFCKACEHLDIKPVFFFDTFDPSIGSVKDLVRWFVPDLLSRLAPISHIVISGRMPIEEISERLGNLREFLEPVRLSTLDEIDSKSMIAQILSEGDEIDFKEPEIKIRFESALTQMARVSRGNPLFLAWFADIFSRTRNTEEALSLQKGFSDPNLSPDDIADKLAGWALRGPLGTLDKAILLAAHSPLRFDLSVYSLLVDKAQLSPYVSHEQVLTELDKLYLVRARGQSRVLHDRIRDAITRVMKHGIMDQQELNNYSRKLVDDYYEVEVRKCHESLSPDSYEYHRTISNLQTERSYHELYVDRSLPTLRRHWENWDNLWHGALFDEMSVALDVADIVLRSLPQSGEQEKLLEAMIDSAWAWSLHSQGQNPEAEKRAKKTLDGKSSDRLRATAAIILGEIAEGRGDHNAAISYFETAEIIYDGLDKRVAKAGDTSVLDKDFLDMDIIGLRKEQHLVLINLGRVNQSQFIRLREAERTFRLAYGIAHEMDKPYFEAEALMHLARVKRYLGEFNEGLDLAWAGLAILRDNPPIFDSTKRIHANLYEVVGLLHKERGDLDWANTYFTSSFNLFDGLGTLGEMGKARTFRNFGDILTRKEQFADAEQQYRNAEDILRTRQSKIPDEWLNLLDKWGLWYAEQGRKIEARRYFEEEREQAKQYNHQFWFYHAEQDLAELDFELWGDDTNGLEALFEQVGSRLKYYQGQHYDFQPQFSRSEELLAQIAERLGRRDEMYEHLVEALGFLARRKHLDFERLLGKIRSKLASETILDRQQVADRLRTKWWDMGLAQLAPSFLKTCQVVGRKVVSLEEQE